MMTPQELERLVMLASDMTVPQQQKWEATSVLSKWTAEEDPRSVASTLLQTLPASQDEQVLFYALTTFQREHLLRSCAIDQRRELRRFLLSGTLSSASTFLRTKAGVVLACLIRVDFPETWPDAFDELRRQASPDLFFRSLDALLEDLDQNPDFDTSRKIRDVMRSLPNAGQNSGTALAPSIAPSQSVSAELLLQLIVYLEQSLSQQAEEIASLALRVLKRFVSWIDMSLVLDDRVMRLVFACLRSSNGDIGVPAVGCLQELIGRGMDEDKKVALLVDADLLAKVHANVDLQTVDASPIEVVIEVAKLIDSTGLQLLPMVERSTNGASSLSRLWSQLTDLFFRCFAYDDIDVSGAVIPLASALAVAMGKEGGSTESGLSAHLPRLMSILYRQSRYPTGFQFDPEDDDEAEEEMYRDDLRKLYQRLIRVSPQLCLQFLCEALSNLPVPISTSATSDVEASLRLVYHYCEGIRPPPGLKIVMKDETFRAVLVALHGSDIVSHSHREVLILYYDVAVRYYPIFLDQPELLQKVLQGMSASSGLQHSHPRVRSRSAYLLLRLVKSVIKVMQPYVETAVNGIQGLLLSSNQDSLRPDDALYLFETTGLLLGKTGLTPSLQQSSLAGVMTPHVRSMEAMLQSELRTQDPGYLGERLARSIAAIAYVSKGFSKPPPEVQSVFMQTIAITLGVLEAFPANDEVRSKSMIFLQRMILCIGSDILPSLPRFLQVLVEQCTVQDAQDVSQLLNQISIKFKEQAVPALDAALLPFLRKCHMLAPTVDDVSVGSNSDIPPHLRTEQLTIQKLSYTVLQHIVSYRATPVLISSTNAGSFERVLHTMKEGATLVQDASVKKACLTFFRELCDQWLADDVVNGAASIRNGYLRYMLETFVPEMLKCFLQPTFDEVDAMQARNVSEFAQILFAVKTKSTRDEYELFLRTLSSNGCPSNIVEAFRTASIASEMELCLKEMLKVLKGRQQG